MAKKSKIPTIHEDVSLINRLLMAFEHARKVDDQGDEYWLAREYGEILGYQQWRNFDLVIERGKAALANEGLSVDDHFAHVRKMVPVGSGAERDVGDIE